MPLNDDLKMVAAPIRADSSRLSDRVAIELGSRIVRGELLPGARLPTEAELCEVFSVSRSVIRDAIRMLSARGLVDVRQGHGMVVYPASDATFSESIIVLLMRSDVTMGEVIDARAVIETELAPLVVDRGTDEDLKALCLELERYDAAVQNGDWLGAQTSHLGFHFSLLESLHMSALQILLKPMQQIILLSSLPGVVAETDLSKVWTADDVARHRPILEALERRDAESVRGAMASHFLGDNEVLASNRQHLFRDSQVAQGLLHKMLTATSAPPAR